MKRFETSDGLRLAYHDEGTGPALLCLAGLTRNSADFDFLGALLPGYRVIRLDYRGRGDSDHDPEFANYTPIIEARDAVELLDHLGIGSAPVLGTSRGGIVAMAMAATCKDRIAGAILNDIGPDLEVEGLSRIAEMLGVQPTANTIKEAACSMEAAAIGFANVPHRRWVEECRRRYRFVNGQPRLSYDPKLRDAVIDSLNDPSVDLWPLFDALAGLPLAVIRGANSDLLSRETLGRMRSRRPDLVHLEVAGRGHCPFLDEPESIAFIRQFMDNHFASTILPQ